jgi:hypothetical protein
MKSLFLCLFVLTALNAKAADPIQQCDFELRQLETNALAQMSLQVFSENNVLSGKTITTINGDVQSFEEAVTLDERPVRAKLMDEANDEGLNPIEAVIYNFQKLAEETKASPVYAGLMPYDTGIDVSKVRSAKLYTFGKPSHMGATYIVEAKDDAGNLLGSFYAGFFLRPCKK